MRKDVGFIILLDTKYQNLFRNLSFVSLNFKAQNSCYAVTSTPFQNAT